LVSVCEPNTKAEAEFAVIVEPSRVITRGFGCSAGGSGEGFELGLATAGGVVVTGGLCVLGGPAGIRLLLALVEQLWEDLLGRRLPIPHQV
jgi:hypothetical protein